MKRKICSILISCFIAVIWTSVAYGDGLLCGEGGKQQLRNAYNKAIELEKMGKLEDAYKAFQVELGENDSDCAFTKKEDAVIRRIANKLADEAEKKDMHIIAYQWYRAAGNNPAAEKACMKYIKIKSDDFDVFKKKMSECGDKISDSAYLNEIKDIASGNVNRHLEKEEKAFNKKEYSGKHPFEESMDNLQAAENWLRFADAGLKKVIGERAERRGNALSSDKEIISISYSIEYYQKAGNENKIKSVKARANKLGDAYAQKGEMERAVKYYEVAGNSAKAKELSELTEKKKEKSEGQRQKKFKKEQDALEKELGF